MFDYYYSYDITAVTLTTFVFQLNQLYQHVDLICHNEYQFVIMVACFLYISKTLRWSMRRTMETTADYNKEMGLRYKFGNFQY